MARVSSGSVSPVETGECCEARMHSAIARLPGWAQPILPAAPAPESGASPATPGSLEWRAVLRNQGQGTGRYNHRRDYQTASRPSTRTPASPQPRQGPFHVLPEGRGDVSLRSPGILITRFTGSLCCSCEPFLSFVLFPTVFLFICRYSP